MTMNHFSTLFTAPDRVIETLTVEDLAAWQQTEKGSRLLLLPIQRSVVWSNEQVISYWDSLLRGYPAGTMMVHRVHTGAIEANSKGATQTGRLARRMRATSSSLTVSSAWLPSCWRLARDR